MTQQRKEGYYYKRKEKKRGGYNITQQYHSRSINSGEEVDNFSLLYLYVLKSFG
jgi:hypothetical protein